ncbi:MAG: hypothetical protein ACRDFS_11740 [Chloroflexota bacterium]
MYEAWYCHILGCLPVEGGLDAQPYDVLQLLLQIKSIQSEEDARASKP